ncbi:hypothetical protein HGRIS_000831 [Hohenbuehelia grisea]|uniref:Beta/gamma crystallin 'Greek key' domain-containing protein n=1 Tax=Hohenbuehelia grisea TaxID=104357 RepID=A0ABR3IPW5_9AGAR
MKLSLKLTLALATIVFTAGAAPIELKPRQVPVDPGNPGAPAGASNLKVALYRNNNWSGDYVSSTQTGCYNLVGASLNDNVSSFWINTKKTSRCYFYRDGQCSGVDYNTPNSNPNLSSVGWDNVISSFRCD